MPHLNEKDISCRWKSVNETVTEAENVTGNSYVIVTAGPRTRGSVTTQPGQIHKSKRRQNRRAEPYPTSRERVRERTEDSVKDEEPDDGDMKGRRKATRQPNRGEYDSSTISMDLNDREASPVKVEADDNSVMDQGGFQVVKSEAVEPTFAPSSGPTRRLGRESGSLIKREEE